MKEEAACSKEKSSRVPEKKGKAWVPPFIDHPAETRTVTTYSCKVVPSLQWKLFVVHSKVY